MVRGRLIPGACRGEAESSVSVLCTQSWVHQAIPGATLNNAAILRTVLLGTVNPRLGSDGALYRVHPAFSPSLTACLFLLRRQYPPQAPSQDDHNQHYLGYSIDHPHSWVVRNEGPETLIQDPQGTGNFIEIARYPVKKDQSIGDLADVHMAKMLLQAPQWTAFSPSWGGAKTNNSGLYWVLKFTRQKSSSDCAETGEAHIFRSKYIPKKLVGYSITMATCQPTNAVSLQEIRQFLNSFREN